MNLATFPFLMAILPAALIVYQLLMSRHPHSSGLWLAAVSMGAYLLGAGGWDFACLAGSVAANFLLVKLFANLAGRWRLAPLWLGILGNAAFMVSVKLYSQDEGGWLSVGVLGASFFSVQQIALLLEVYEGRLTPPSLLRHFLYISFFPAVASGPISRPSELLPQLDSQRRLNSMDIGAGASLLMIGLIKKIFFADTFAPFANAVLAAPASQLSFSDAWGGAIAFTLQIYFDFSGYSDMACGVARMFGIRLPINFNSPLRASSVVEFWKNWHMSMTRFLTERIYTPMALQLQRRMLKQAKAKWRAFLTVVVLPTFVTFLAIALWHKWSLTLFAYGLTQAFALSVNQAWRQAKGPALPKSLAWLLTFTFVVVTLVLLRSPNMERALLMWKAMAGLHIIALPPQAAPLLSGFTQLLHDTLGTHITFQSSFLVASLPSGWAFWLPIGILYCLVLPNSVWLMRRFRPALIPTATQILAPPALKNLAYRLNIRWTLPLGIACGAALALMGGTDVSTFVYFQY